VFDSVRQLVDFGVVLLDGFRASLPVGLGSVADCDAEHLGERQQFKVVGVGAVDYELVGLV
jgi:hypothetical protein